MIPAVGRLTFHFLHCPPSRQHRQEWTDGIASNFCAAEETADVEDDLRRGDDICTPLRGVVNTQSAPVSCHEGDAEAAGRRAGGQLGDVAQPLPRGGGGTFTPWRTVRTPGAGLQGGPGLSHAPPSPHTFPPSFCSKSDRIECGGVITARAAV